MLVTMKGFFREEPKVTRWSFAGKEKISLKGVAIVEADIETDEPIEVLVTACDEVAEAALAYVNGKSISFIAELEEVENTESGEVEDMAFKMLFVDTEGIVEAQQAFLREQLER